MRNIDASVQICLKRVSNKNIFCRTNHLFKTRFLWLSHLFSKVVRLIYVFVMPFGSTFLFFLFFFFYYYYFTVSFNILTFIHAYSIKIKFGFEMEAKCVSHPLLCHYACNMGNFSFMK